jgi:hypothetical protein
MWSSSLVLMARLADYLGSLQIWFMFRHIVLNMRFVFESNKNNVVLYCYVQKSLGSPACINITLVFLTNE